MRKLSSLTYLFLLMGLILVFTSSCKKDDNNDDNTVTDVEGNVYKTVKIGSQIWMSENLRTTKYNDGTSISNVTDAGEWSAITAGAYCNYKNTSNLDTINTFGRLYNWYAVNTDKLAPKGWHVPTDTEWATLTDFLGGEDVAGGKLKETGTTHWSSPNIGATNETGFTALPGGGRGSNGNFYYIGLYGDWWSATQSTSNIWCRRIYYDGSTVGRSSYIYKTFGFGIRCVKD